MKEGAQQDECMGGSCIRNKGVGIGGLGTNTVTFCTSGTLKYLGAIKYRGKQGKEATKA